jgi:hypothetical protein
MMQKVVSADAHRAHHQDILRQRTPDSAQTEPVTHVETGQKLVAQARLNAALQNGTWVVLDDGRIALKGWKDPLSAADPARLRIDHLRALLIVPNAQEVASAILGVWLDVVWEEIGYASWAEFTKAELSGAPRLTKKTRRAVCIQLSADGMSARAIGAALGVSDFTVRKDLSSASNHAPEVTDDRPTPESLPRPKIRRISAESPGHAVSDAIAIFGSHDLALDFFRQGHEEAERRLNQSRADKRKNRNRKRTNNGAQVIQIRRTS